jgi:hypothetical protein
MASIGKSVRVANPPGRRRRKTFRALSRKFARKSKPGKRKRSKRNSAPAIRRYSVKTLKKELHRRGTKPNRRNGRRYTAKRSYRRPARRRSNPTLLELGVINPHFIPKRRKKHVAKRAKSRRKKSYRRSNPRRRHVAVARPRRRRRTRRSYRMSNPVHRVHRRRRNARRHQRRSYQRNPSVFGRGSSKDLLMMTGGVLVGVAVTKYLPTLLPASITAALGGSSAMGVVITAAGAFVAGWAAKRFIGEPFGDAVLLGGLAQAASQLLNIIAPPQLSSALALSGMGDIIPGMYVVPQNPVRAGMPVPVPAKGVGAFRGAFGNRR